MNSDAKKADEILSSRISDQIDSEIVNQIVHEDKHLHLDLIIEGLYSVEQGELTIGAFYFLVRGLLKPSLITQQDIEWAKSLTKVE